MMRKLKRQLVKGKINKMPKHTIYCIRELHKKHANSPVEFARAGKMVICSEDYKIRVVDKNELQKHINELKRVTFEMYANGRD